MAVSAFDNPLLAHLLGSAAINACFTAEADIRAMLDFERTLAVAQAAEGVIPPEAGAAIASACLSFVPDMDRLARATARDGVVVPEFVRQLRAAVNEPYAQHVHKGSTSQDVIDTGLFIRLARVCDLLAQGLRDCFDRIGELEAKFGDVKLMGHTRMQRARPITFRHKAAAWREPLLRDLQRLDALRPRLLVLQLGGAVGNRAELGEQAQAIVDYMARALGLAPLKRAQHAERDGVTEFAQWLALVAGSLGKIGADIALMAQNEVSEVKVAEGGGSSAMPDKSNPVKAEVLVTLAHYTAALSAAAATAMVHENERSGSAWTLEWLTLPQMCAATGGALRIAGDLLAGLTVKGA
jgi:3-carboxy-cis,cis-muconate cycloisomerase